MGAHPTFCGTLVKIEFPIKLDEISNVSLLLVWIITGRLFTSMLAQIAFACRDEGSNSGLSFETEKYSAC